MGDEEVVGILGVKTNVRLTHVYMLVDLDLTWVIG